MKVLIVSKESWRDDSNGGNVLSSLFQDTPFEFAQIFFSGEKPHNQICKQYLQITDSDIIYSLKSCFRNNVERIGHVYSRNNVDNLFSTENHNDDGVVQFANRKKYSILYLLQEIAWKMTPLSKTKISEFVNEFKPDVIFAPCYANVYMLRVNEYISKISQAPIISYISDDNYSLKLARIEPSAWIRRIWVRKYIRRMMQKYSLLYTMTQEQKEELEKEFDVRVKILMKCADFSGKRPSHELKDSINLIYAGGVYLNRWKILAQISKAITKLNGEKGIKYRLDIYTKNDLTQEQRKQFNDENTFIHKPVTTQELEQIYHSSDIAIHCESLDLKYRYDTRLSFSTKIVDCLHSGCAILAIAWKKHSGIMYLERNNAAFCVYQIKDIEKELAKIKNAPGLIAEYANNAWACGVKNHDKINIQNSFVEDIEKVVCESEGMGLHDEN